jgi:hypothetical protein
MSELAKPAEKPGAFAIFGLLLALGAGIMIFLSLISEGFKDFFMNMTIGLMGYRQVKGDFLQFIAVMLLFAAIGMMIFTKKDSGGAHHG